MVTSVRIVLRTYLAFSLLALAAVQSPAAYDSATKDAPPPELRESEGEIVQYANGIQARHTRLVTTSVPVALLPPGGPQVVDSFFDIFTEVSTDGGGTWMPFTAQASSRMLYTGRPTPPAGTDSFFDAEMQQLDITGLPMGVMIRESPTLASPGQTSFTLGGGGGGYHVDSFFDIFTEVSLDAGNSWSPGTSMHVVGVPEPGTVAMLAAAALCMAGCLWRRKK